jgi:3-methyladenine DNA glycosylase AlkD
MSRRNRTSRQVQEIQSRLRALGNPENAKALRWFFKTGPGQYGEGDKFAGVKVPTIRELAKEYRTLSLADAESLLHSPIHEERLLSLVILVLRAAKADEKVRKAIFDLYLANTNWINNWDLVDLSAPQLVGAYLEGRSRKVLYRLARSKSLWERRISVLATFHFVRQGDYGDTLAIAELLLRDRDDLIHKAVGWMLREVGKRDIMALEGFLQKHSPIMPRTMLRYAIEKFPEATRQTFLQKKPQSPAQQAKPTAENSLRRTRPAKRAES